MLSLAQQAVRGAAWTVGSSLAGRIVGVVGTLALTRFLAPEVMGEVGVASILVLTAHQLSTAGLGQYVVAKPRAGRAVIFHATVLFLAFGSVAFAALWAFRDHLGPMFDAPGMVAYLPGLLLATLLDRVSFIPQRVLLRDMRFKVVAISRSLAEFAFTGVAVSLAAGGLGGEAVVYGNLARSALRSIVFVVAVNWRDWLSAARLKGATAREILSFGVPVSLGGIAGFAARRWDNLLFSSLFGPATMGLYNLAYNLADIPAEQIGEHIGDVLLPSFAHLDPASRPDALVRSTSLLSLVVFPLAVGLATVADPLVQALFTEAWQGVAPFLIILCVLSVVRPVGWTITSYLQATNLPRDIMYLSFGKVILLLGLIAGLGQISPVWACAGVGFAYALHSLAGLFVVRRRHGLSLSRVFAGMIGPLWACAVMAAAVLAVVFVLGDVLDVSPVWQVAAGIAVGAPVYVGAAFVLAPAVARDCFSLLRRSLRRG